MNNTGLCSILMNGEDVALLFAMPACEYFQKKIEEGSILVDDDGNTVGNTSIAFLIHAGYWNYCIGNGYSPKKKIGDFLQWIEDSVEDPVVQDQLLTVANTFRDSRSLSKFKERAEKAVEELKKKTAELTGTKLNPSVTENSASVQNSTAD